MLATRHGLSIRFHESDVREMGRDTTGVKGIELGAATTRSIGMVVIKREATLLVVTEKGIGQVLDDRRVPRAEARREGDHHVNRTEKTGDVVALMEVLPEDELMLITQAGDRDPHAGEGDPRGGPEHAGRASW